MSVNFIANYETSSIYCSLLILLRVFNTKTDSKDTFNSSAQTCFHLEISYSLLSSAIIHILTCEITHLRHYSVSNE